MKELRFIKRCIELTGKGLASAIRMLYRVILKPRAYVKVRSACLTAFIALNGFAVALVLFLAYFIIEDSWSFRLPECSGPRAAPPPLQIQIFCDGENSTLDAIVAPEKDQRTDEIVTVLRHIQQALENDNGSVSNVVIDPKENPWIDKLINALRDAGERQSVAPVAGANPISSVVVLRDKNPWIDELLTVLRSVVETQVTDATVRKYIEKQMHCADDENSSAECPASESVERGAVVPELSERIWEQMGCPADKRLKMSGFIRFSNNDATIKAPAKTRIDNFVEEIDKQGTKWGVFGFASEAGEKKRNRELSWQRACKVTKYISDKYNCVTSGLDCKTCPKGKNGKVDVRYKCPASGNRETEFLIRFPGEDHFINGVADSRSVVIAACKTKE